MFIGCDDIWVAELLLGKAFCDLFSMQQWTGCREANCFIVLGPNSSSEK